MQQLSQRLIPLGVDVDISPLYIKTDRAYFLKGIESGWLINGGQGANEAELKPSESNFLYCSVTLPAGVNNVIGYYYYAEANEGYVVVYNSNGYHLIYRLRGIDGQADIVYNFCQWFKGISLKPKYFFSKGRMTIKSLCRYLPDGSKELYKELFLVNTQVDNLRIVVEDSIATNSFTTPFFNRKDICCGDSCRIVKSGVPTPIGKIKVVPIPVTDADMFTQNTMLYRMFQFRFVDENAWGQRSEHGLISDPYFNNLAGCSKDASSQPHCVWLEVKTPCPEIVKRTVEYRSCQLKNNSIGTDGNLLSEWKEAYTVDLYDKSNPDLKWYQRIYDTSNKEFQFFDDGKKMRLKFCNNRECKTIALADIRSQNPAPINSGTVAPIGKGLGYGRNENDLPKFSKEDIKSIKLELVKNAGCEIKYSNIKVYAVVHNYDTSTNEPVYNAGGTIGFGGFGEENGLLGQRTYETNTFSPGKGLQEDGGYGQTFPTGVKGFRGELIGTKYTAESKQFIWTPADLLEVEPYIFSLDFISFMSTVKQGEKLLIQCFDFGLVPNGNYRFGINSHDDIPGMALSDTSTYYRENAVWADYKNSFSVDSSSESEIIIDTTNGADYNSITENIVAVIQDLTYPGHNAFAVRGYLYEDELTKQPIELAEIHKTRADDYIVGITDRNGFFFWTTQYGQDYRLQLKGPAKCDFNTLLGQTEVKKKKGTTLVPNLYVVNRVPAYITDVCNRYYITGKISECITGGGIEGIAVGLTRTKPVFTNSKGEFKIIAHYMNGRGNDSVIMSMAGSCNVVDCNCGPITTKITVTQPTCTSCVEKNQNLGNFSLKTVVAKGFPHGSRIQIGMSGKDWLGRETAIQTNEELFIDFPTEQEQGDETYSSLKIILPDKFSNAICSNFSHLTFYWSKNTNYEDFFTWAADQIKFVDNAGKENKNSPTKVQIYYRSLNEYNILRGLNTNTTWSILDTQGNTRLGDIVEFIKSADGIYFPPNTIGVVQYDKDGNYFLIDYDESLRDLKDGVKFKFKRPYECEVKKTFYEHSFPVNFCKDGCVPMDDDGNVVKEFIMDAFSSYSIPRQIPVVTDVITKVPGNDGGTQDLITQTKTIKIYPFTFEHHSPSDTWGDHCNSGGRINYINPYEGKRCDRNQVLLTGSLNQANDGAINYLHYFSLSDEYVIDEQGWGGITALLSRDDGQLLLICEFTVFSFRTNDDRATVDENGYLRLPISSIFSKPERQPSFNFGCQENDVNTIDRIDSMVVFLDTQKQELVIHDFNQATPITEGIQSWLIPSIKEVKAHPDTKYWHTSFDMRLKKIFLTKFDLSTDQYQNNEIDYKLEMNETFAFYYEQKVWRMHHCTPEYFGGMYGDQKDIQLFSFKNGQPYFHHSVVNPSIVYLNYFGVQCIPVIGVVTNKDPHILKSFLANQFFCRELLFILERLESSMGQESKIYEGQWTSGDGYSSAGYLCDTKNPDGCNEVQSLLMDGDCMYGKWLKALYIPNPEYKGEFFLLSYILSIYENRAGTG